MNESKHFKPLTDWGFSFPRPMIISGPCGVESEEQIYQTAKALSKFQVHLLRGGIWKPRSRPDSFQGIGSAGLRWLKDAGKKNNLPVTVEVANAKHVEEALTAGIDVLWLGARTTVNPFQVQEIADALKGVDIPVMIKNPINPELELWIGAIERILKTGNNRIAAIHRGFSTFEKTKYRNVPNWQIPIELKRRLPELSLICDPSHISGRRELIQAVSQIALDLDYDGLMIESHINPDKALSDAQQQLNPDELGKLLENLIVRSAKVDDIIFMNLLDELRDKIDQLDSDILNMLANRMKIAREIGQYKKENNMTILQVERWDEILKTRLKIGLNKELSKEFVTKLYEIIHDESILHQAHVMNKKTNAEESNYGNSILNKS